MWQCGDCKALWVVMCLNCALQINFPCLCDRPDLFHLCFSQSAVSTRSFNGFYCLWFCVSLLIGLLVHVVLLLLPPPVCLELHLAPFCKLWHWSNSLNAPLSLNQLFSCSQSDKPNFEEQLQTVCLSALIIQQFTFHLKRCSFLIFLSSPIEPVCVLHLTHSL